MTLTIYNKSGAVNRRKRLLTLCCLLPTRTCPPKRISYERPMVSSNPLTNIESGVGGMMAMG